MHWQRLLTQPLFLAVPTGHRLARQTEVHLAEVADEDFVMLHQTWALRGLSDELCAAAGFVPRVAFEADDLPVIRGFVKAGLGVAIVPAASSALPPASTRSEPLLRIVDDGAHRQVGLAWSEERRLQPSAELFRQFVLGRDQ